MTLIPKTSAHFSTSLASKITSSAASMSLVSGTDKAGNALSGLYGFVLDKGSASEEFMLGTISGTTVTITARGLDPGDGKTEVTALKLSHRRGASVDITDYPSLAIFGRVLNGDETIPNVVSYASHPTFNNNQQIPDKQYVDGVAVAGASNADDTTKGIVERATQAEIEAGTASGGTGAALFVSADRLGAKLYYGYAADAGANDTYVITLTPAPTAYTTGMVILFKANTANTGACTLNANSLGAKSLKVNGADPRDNYIKAGSFVLCNYEGTNLNILSVSSQPQTSQDSNETYAVDAVGTDAYAITLTPAITAYVTGEVFRFKAGTANTGTASLAVNGLAAKTIKKYVNGALTTLADNDILSGQLVTVAYESTADAMILQSPTANTPNQQTIYKNGLTTRDISTASGNQTIAHGLGVTPKFIRITANLGTASAVISTSTGTYNGTTTATVYQVQNAGTSELVAGDGANIVLVSKDTSLTDYASATITVDATNITLAWTKHGAASGTANLMWEAFGN